MRHCCLPHHLYVNVSNRFLGPSMPQGVTPGIWWGVHCRPGQAVMCHVLLASGAHWSGLPIHAVSRTESFDLGHRALQPWGAMGDRIEAFGAEYLDGLAVEVLRPFAGAGRHTGIVIDWVDGFSRYPQEHKPLNLIELESGQYALLPNNFVLFADSHFTNPNLRDQLAHYRRGESLFWE